MRLAYILIAVATVSVAGMSFAALAPAQAESSSCCCVSCDDCNNCSCCCAKGS